jgi:hypothetical protein
MGVGVSLNLNSPRERAAKTPPRTTRTAGRLYGLGPRPGPNVTLRLFQNLGNAVFSRFSKQKSISLWSRNLAYLDRRFTAVRAGHMRKSDFDWYWLWKAKRVVFDLDLIKVAK